MRRLPVLWSASWIPFGLFVGAFLLIASTASHYGLAWDEPSYFHATDLHTKWLKELLANIASGQPEKSLSDTVIGAAWHWDPYHVPHPPFSRIVSGLAREVFAPVMDVFTSYRLGPALFFAGLVTTMYLWMSNLFNRLTGLLATFLLVLTPNLFGFAHFAVTDIPLTALWFLSLYCFWRGLKDWRWSLILGVVWGLALSTKFPALLIPIPLLFWAHCRYRESYHNNIFAMFFLSPLIMIASQPYLWHNTSLRLLEYLYEGLARGYRPDTNHSIFFFNAQYSTATVPWYYPFFMTLVSIPETILLLIMGSVFGSTWTRVQLDAMFLFALNALFILSVGLLPGAVLHDVNRLMLPALPFLVAIAGGGAFLLLRRLEEWHSKLGNVRPIKGSQTKVITVVFFLLLFPAALDLLIYHPFELSYYNRLVGGIRGAYQRGLEVTYFMEALTPDFVSFLNKRLPANAVINGSFSNFMLKYYQEQNRLRRDFRITDSADFDYYILLNRRSVLSDKDRSFLGGGIDPYDAFRLDGVPLILIYKKTS